MNIRAICALLLLALWVPPLTAQEKRSLADRIVDSVGKHEKWELKKNDRVASMELNVFYLEWRTEKSWLDALIKSHATADIAREMFSKKGPELGPTLGGGMRLLDTKVPNLGDENYMWERKGRQGIVFRRANVFVIVNAGSMENATKLARYIAKEISE